jgi:hypothetical protein
MIQTIFSSQTKDRQQMSTADKKETLTKPKSNDLFFFPQLCKVFPSVMQQHIIPSSFHKAKQSNIFTQISITFLTIFIKKERDNLTHSFHGLI